jgi:DNA-binding GntR family transcriptional regulator
MTNSNLQTFRTKIITGELKPGQRLTENSLSQELSISRPLVREMLRILEEDNLVVYIPRRGTSVAELSLSDCEEICQTREMIECFTVELLKASNTRYLPKVETALNVSSTLVMTLDRTNPEKLLNSIMHLIDFHYRLVESAGNLQIIDIYRSMSYSLARYQYVYFKANVNGTVQQSLDDHENVLNLIKNGEFDLAKEKLREHIKYAEEFVKNTLFR